MLAFADLGDLGTGERGVEQEHRRAELRRRDGGLDEARVIAAEDRDSVPLADARLAQAVSERIGLLVQLRERRGPAIVVDRWTVRVAHRRDCVAGGGRRSPAIQEQRGADQLVGPVESQDTGANQHPGRVQRGRQTPQSSHRSIQPRGSPAGEKISPTPALPRAAVC
jgi:hypothetical protein